jgi:hypothetical protein
MRTRTPGTSSQFGNVLAGEKLKLLFALYATVNDEVNIIGPRIPKKLLKRAGVLNHAQYTAFNVRRDPRNCLRKHCGSS